MALLDLNPDQLLSTTRAVRKRLDFARPVPGPVIRECVAMALQAPSGSNVVTMRFVVVRDEKKRRAIGGIDRTAALAGLGNILPAMWSFMLAARARGLGTAWTSMHRAREQDVADILGIPYDTVAQAVLTPLAYTTGTTFKPAARPDPDVVTHWDNW